MAGARTILRDASADSDRYTLLVAVANPEHVDQLIRTAVDLAEERAGELLLVSVIHKPVTSPFLLFSPERIETEFDDGRSPTLDRAVSAVADSGAGSSVPVRRHLLVGSDVSEAILRAAMEANADALLLGWQERRRPSDIVLGQTVDRVVARAPCDVFVERVGSTTGEMTSILLPTVGGPHVEPVTDLASAVAAANDATVSVVSFVPPTASTAERSAARDCVDATAALLPDVSVACDVRETDDAATAIVESATDHDLVVLGATRDRTLRRRIVGSVAETVARRAEPPVVIAKRRSDRSLLARIHDWMPIDTSLHRPSRFSDR